MNEKGRAPISRPGIGDYFPRSCCPAVADWGVLNPSDIKTFGDVMFISEWVWKRSLVICGALRRFSVIIGISMASSQSMDSSVGRIVNQGTGSHRYEMIFKGPGGHSFQELGRPSAVHAMGRAIAKIAEVQTPEGSEDDVHGRHGTRRYLG